MSHSPEGAFESDVVLRQCPDLLVFDHDFVRQALPRTLASAVDALAMVRGIHQQYNSSDGLQQAVQMARVPGTNCC